MPLRRTNFPACIDVQRWLASNHRSHQWLVDEMNRRRANAGIAGSICRSTVWRWLVGKTRITLDDATLIFQITGTPVERWSWWSMQPDQRATASPDPTE
jgi:hypothetical protein